MILGVVQVGVVSACRDPKPQKRTTQKVATEISSSASRAASAWEHRPDLLHHVTASGFDGLFVLWRQDAPPVCIARSLAQCQADYPPASTFKVPIALLAIEHKAIPSIETKLVWDGTAQPFESWQRDHDLKSAMRVSAGWFFAELATRIGRNRLAAGLAMFDYGNRQLANTLTTSWTDGTLRVTPKQQLRLWHRLHEETLPLAPATQSAVKSITERRRKDGYVFRGKTGWYRDGDNHLGWGIGCVAGDKRTCFATLLWGENVPSKTFLAQRFLTAQRILSSLEVPGHSAVPAENE